MNQLNIEFQQAAALSASELKVEVMDVRMGMYISALDIPWEESRFIFKGFLVGEESHLAEIKRVCQHVIVDRSRSTTTDFVIGQETANPAKQPSPAQTPETPHPKVVAIKQTTPAPKLPIRKRLYKSVLIPLLDMLSFAPKVQPNFNPDKVHQSSKHKKAEMKEDLIRMQVAKDIRTQFEFSNSEISDKMTNYVTQASLTEEAPVAIKAQSNLLKATRAMLAADMNDSSLHVSVMVAKEAVTEVVDSIARNPEAMHLVNNIRNLDEYSYQHAIDVSLLMVALGREMCLFKNDLVEVGLGGMLHDCGEVKPKGVSQPGIIRNITKFRIYKDDHVQNGIEIARKTNQSRIVTEIIANHHEYFDGSGYPNGKKGGQIGLYGNMIVIVDTYVSLINGRSCKEPVTPNVALDYMYKQKGKLFHPQMLDQFIQVIGLYPVGTMVKLNSGDIGFVIKQNKSWRTKPVVMIVMNRHHEKLEKPIHIDLMVQPKNKKEITIVSDLPMDAHGLKVEDYLKMS